MATPKTTESEEDIQAEARETTPSTLAFKKTATKKKAAGHVKPKSVKAGATHTEHEDDPWTINIGDHPQRKDSPGYLASRKAMIKIVQDTQPCYFGNKPYQDHHGGGLWVKDEQGWLLVKNLAGIEWSAQFCADPSKVEALRKNAQRIYAKFPLSAQGFKDLGYKNFDKILTTPIKTAQDVATWTDSIFNASVPLPAPRHTGVVSKKGDVLEEGGVHHYPTPITDIELIKRNDFTLWVVDEEGNRAAVVPVKAPGSGDSHVSVAFATPGSKLHEQLSAAHKAGKRLVVPGSHHLAQQAFKKQNKKKK
ncbi:MAG TPA: DUF6424 family protein [Blastocatellia bacterium]|nr:DUF6424 family protein [Blastocatellia bacterium]